MVNFDLPEVRGKYRFGYNLAPITWFKVGGKAEIFFKPEDVEDLSFFLKNLDPAVNVTILGNCSNVIIRDGGIDGVVVKLGKNFAKIQLEKRTKIKCGAGALNYYVSNFALNNSKSALEFLIGIPGTIGGGIKMNAGAYGSEFKDVLSNIKAIDRKGNIFDISPNDAGFGYRKSSIPDDYIFVEAEFNVNDSDQKIISEKMAKINEQRSSTQPVKEKTGGSTFANPSEYKAWELIDKVGMRGYKIGDAGFSELHCNFMINHGNATAKDLEDLGELARDKVREKFSQELKWEIRRIGKK